MVCKYHNLDQADIPGYTNLRSSRPITSLLFLLIKLIKLVKTGKNLFEKVKSEGILVDTVGTPKRFVVEIKLQPVAYNHLLTHHKKADEMKFCFNSNFLLHKIRRVLYYHYYDQCFSINLTPSPTQKMN